jgi:chromosome segregation ATPase
MMMDVTSLFLATGAAALLVGGGAMLRPALAKRELASAPPAPLAPAESAESDQKLRDAEQALAALKSEFASANQTREAQRQEMVELRQRMERQQQAADAESKRLGSELVAEKGRNVELEKLLVQAKSDAKTAQEELEKARTTAGTGSDAKTITALQDEIQSLQPLKTKVAAVTQERDAARGKVEALERLIEGVRARSRQLAEELKALKKE